MTALTSDRATPKSSGLRVNLPVAATKKIFIGGLICISATGYALPGYTATTLKTIGIAEYGVDNSSGADGDLRVTVERTPAWLVNSGADAVGQADIGSSCYVVDDQTVAKTNGTNTRSVAGKVLDVDASLGVLVSFA